MSNANNPINNTIGASISGVTNTLTITNPSNTASSAAREKITVGGGTAADPTLNFNISGVTDWEVGIDNDVNDNLTISQSTALGTKDVWRMTTAGARTMPLQPAFKAGLNVNKLNVTGDGTAYTIPYNATTFDQTSSFNTGTGKYVIPATGLYFFHANCTVLNTTAAMSGSVIDIEVNGVVQHRVNTGDLNKASDLGGAIGVQITTFLPCTAADLISIVITLNFGTKTAGILGSVVETSFSGFLVC